MGECFTTELQVMPLSWQMKPTSCQDKIEQFPVNAKWAYQDKLDWLPETDRWVASILASLV